MSVNTFQAYPDNSSDVNFRAWGKGISDAFAAVGLVKTADTGQVDWATAAHPTGSNEITTFYEIWRFDDGALQTACPVFFKIWYGSGGNANGPRMQIYVGQGSDGSGKLTGTIATYLNLYGYAPSTVAQYSCFISSDSGRINVALFVGTTSQVVGGFYIERIKDDTGSATADGVNIVKLSNEGTTASQQYLPLSGAAYPASPMVSYMCAFPYTEHASYGSDVGLFPIYPNLGYAANPDLGALVYSTYDIGAAGSIIAVDIYGVSHNFVTIGGMIYAPTINGNSGAAISLAMRYE
jgi:hypothetical protein